MPASSSREACSKSRMNVSAALAALDSVRHTPNMIDQLNNDRQARSTKTTWVTVVADITRSIGLDGTAPPLACKSMRIGSRFDDGCRGLRPETLPRGCLHP